MVPGDGLEPSRSFLRGILSPLCLPIPPPGRVINLFYRFKIIKEELTQTMIGG